MLMYLCCARAALAGAPTKDKVAQSLQDISVTIRAEGSEGSGVVKTREIDGKQVNFVWTAEHVIDSLRTVREVIDPKSGTKRQVVSYRDAEIIKELVEDGRRVGELKMDAEVIRCSDQEDLALLRIRKRDFVAASVTFYLKEEIPPIGTDLYHVGSLLGQTGANSMTSGIVSQIGRILDKQEFDQTTCTSFPGSSGGGVFLRSGEFVGLIVRGAGEGFNLMIPVRRVRRFAKEAGVQWAVDDAVPTPSDAELKKLPIEHTGVEFTRTAGDDDDLKAFPLLIRLIALPDSYPLTPTPAPVIPHP